MGEGILRMWAGFALAAAALAATERLFSPRRHPLPRPGWRVDLAYWLVNPPITRALMGLALSTSLVALVLLSGVPLEKEAMREFLWRPRSLAAQPAWLQMLQALLIGDLIAYWPHRWLHRRRLWRFHAIHHSPRYLDWLSATRLHPVNDVLVRLPPILALYLMGYDVKVLALYAPAVSFHSLLVHANLTWDFGPLRWLIVSPRYHRWHHTTERMGRDKNFVGLFPFIDWIFGTYHLPRDRMPEKFGIEEDDMPESLLGQLAYPFRRKASHG